MRPEEGLVAIRDHAANVMGVVLREELLAVIGCITEINFEGDLSEPQRAVLLKVKNFVMERRKKYESFRSIDTGLLLRELAASGELSCPRCACERDPGIWLGKGKWFETKPAEHAPGCQRAYQ